MRLALIAMLALTGCRALSTAPEVLAPASVRTTKDGLIEVAAAWIEGNDLHVVAKFTLESAELNETWWTQVYLNTDRNTFTGYNSGPTGMGAEYVGRVIDLVGDDFPIRIADAFGWHAESGTGQIERVGKRLHLFIPLAALGNPTSVDVTLEAEHFSHGHLSYWRGDAFPRGIAELQNAAP